MKFNISEMIVKMCFSVLGYIIYILLVRTCKLCLKLEAACLKGWNAINNLQRYLNLISLLEFSIMMKH